jgi:toxin ParE1/3/4
VKFVWLEPALNDRIAIFEHIEPENPRAAEELDIEFEKAAARISRHPDMGRPGRIADTREYVIGRRYFLLYRTKGDVLEIMAVIHTSRQWPPLT